MAGASGFISEEAKERWENTIERLICPRCESADIEVKEHWWARSPGIVPLPDEYSVRCEYCGLETHHYSTQGEAIVQWRKSPVLHDKDFINRRIVDGRD